MADVFISYSSQDRAVAAELASELEQAGVSAWWDRELVAGEDFDRVIEKEIEDSKIVLVLWSEGAASSRWVRDEASLAIKLDKYCPVKISAMTLPLGFRSQHVIDASKGGDSLPSRVAVILIGGLGQIDKLRIKYAAAATSDGHRMAFAFMFMFVFFGLMAGHFQWEPKVAPMIAKFWPTTWTNEIMSRVFFVWIAAIFVFSLILSIWLTAKLGLWRKVSPEELEQNPDYKPPRWGDSR